MSRPIYIVGAGFSRAVGGRMPLVCEMADPVRKGMEDALDSDLLSVLPWNDFEGLLETLAEPPRLFTVTEREQLRSAYRRVVWNYVTTPKRVS